MERCGVTVLRNWKTAVTSMTAGGVKSPAAILTGRYVVLVRDPN